MRCRAGRRRVRPAQVERRFRPIGIRQASGSADSFVPDDARGSSVDALADQGSPADRAADSGQYSGLAGCSVAGGKSSFCLSGGWVQGERFAESSRLSGIGHLRGCGVPVRRAGGWAGRRGDASRLLESTNQRGTRPRRTVGIRGRRRRCPVLRFASVRDRDGHQAGPPGPCGADARTDRQDRKCPLHAIAPALRHQLAHRGRQVVDPTRRSRAATLPDRLAAREADVTCPSGCPGPDFLRRRSRLPSLLLRLTVEPAEAHRSLRRLTAESGRRFGCRQPAGQAPPKRRSVRRGRTRSNA
ncbi:MAG: hypothetical protein QOF10_1440 [Kribbellaceae bacterium]|nr:hypothetical protein [Kribbellaceae bacterium]